MSEKNSTFEGTDRFARNLEKRRLIIEMRNIMELKKTNIQEAANIKEFQQVCNIIDLHTARALAHVNEEHLLTCWEIGAYLSNRIKNGKWGDKIVRELADHIRKNRPLYSGYSRTNLYNMMLFYDTYSSADFSQLMDRNQQIVQPLAGQLQPFVQPVAGQMMPAVLSLVTYSHHIILLNRCETLQERLFYMIYAYRQHLNKRQLAQSIVNQTYETLLGRDQKDMSAALVQTYPQAPVMFKDRLMLSSLGLPPTHKEPKLHKAIVTHMRDFILELGKEDFFFVEDEYPITVGGDTFHLDLLFYHRVLHCYVAIELKSGKFHPKDLGQLEFYLEAIDRDKKRTDEGPSIGILLCKEATKTVVEYALSRSMSPVMVAQYKQALIPQEVLQKAFDEYIEMNAPKMIEGK